MPASALYISQVSTLEEIDSLLYEAQRQYDRSKEARQRHGNIATLYAVKSATRELELVQQRKQELLDKKKLVML